MLAIKGRSKDPATLEKVFEALICKAWGCRPSELEHEKAEDVMVHSVIYAELMKKNPFL